MFQALSPAACFIEHSCEQVRLQHSATLRNARKGLVNCLKTAGGFKIFFFSRCFREKYLNTLRQVEMMLKLWFPQISAQSVTSSSSAATSPARALLDTSRFTPPHKRRDQLHIPVKVRAHAFLGVQKPTWTNKVLKAD